MIHNFKFKDIQLLLITHSWCNITR